MNDGEYIRIISKKQWFKKMNVWQKTLRKVLKRYKLHYKLTKRNSEKARLLRYLIAETEESILHNKRIMLIGKLEEDHLIYSLDETGLPTMTRWGKNRPNMLDYLISLDWLDFWTSPPLECIFSTVYINYER